MKVKNKDYIVIQDFMVKELKLKGNELLIYAIIYGFCQKERAFTESLQYLADWTNSTKQGVIKALKSLIDKELIGKTEIYINSAQFIEYNVILQPNEINYSKEFHQIQKEVDSDADNAIARSNKGELMKDEKTSLESTIGSDNFIEMPLSAQALYFHFSLRAVNGVVSNPKTIQRILCTTEEDLCLLIEKGYVNDLGCRLIIPALTNTKENKDDGK